jgi:hypothetical protein
MTHRYDRRPVDREAVRAMANARKWHEAMNKDLEKHGKKPEHLMVNAIRKAEKYGIIGDHTAKRAHEIRKNGNKGRHEF